MMWPLFRRLNLPDLVRSSLMSDVRLTEQLCRELNFPQPVLLFDDWSALIWKEECRRMNYRQLFHLLGSEENWTVHSLSSSVLDDRCALHLAIEERLCWRLNPPSLVFWRMAKACFNLTVELCWLKRTQKSTICLLLGWLMNFYFKCRFVALWRARCINNSSSFDRDDWCVL